jgi:hypothetical protein
MVVLQYLGLIALELKIFKWKGYGIIFFTIIKIEGKLALTLTLNHVTFAILAVSRVKTIGRI